MVRFKELLEKRKNLTASIFEERELIEMSKTLTKDQLKDIDVKLLTYSNEDRLESLDSKLDKMLSLLDEMKEKL